jgi:hypothetical protein
MNGQGVREKERKYLLVSRPAAIHGGRGGEEVKKGGFRGGAQHLHICIVHTRLPITGKLRVMETAARAPRLSSAHNLADASNRLFVREQLIPSPFACSDSELSTMPLEATMIVLDNSEYMRNGDYQPTRFGALADAVTTVFQTKIDSNPENTVGVMTMANKGCVRAHPHSKIEKNNPPF